MWWSTSPTFARMPNAWRESPWPDSARHLESASAYSVAPRSPRNGAGNTELRRGPSMARASTSQRRGPMSGSPMGMSMPTAASPPESSAANTPRRSASPSTPLFPAPSTGAVTITHPPRQPSSPATTVAAPIAPRSSALAPGGDDARLEREDDGLDPVAEPELAEDPADMGLHSRL